MFPSEWSSDGCSSRRRALSLKFSRGGSLLGRRQSQRALNLPAASDDRPTEVPTRLVETSVNSGLSMVARRLTGRPLRLALFLAVPLVAHSASAQGSAGSPIPATAPGSPEQRFSRAQLLFDGKNFADALPQFEALVAETGSPNARLYVARCLRELGRLTQAYDEMRATVALATEKAKTDDRYVETRNASASELAQLKPRVGHLVVVAGTGTPSRIAVNSEPVDVAKLQAPITVLPGRVVVEVTGADGAVQRREIEVQPGATATVSFAAGSAGESPRGGELRWIGVALGATGVAAFLVAIGTGVAAGSLFAEIEEACGGVRCEGPSFASDVDEGRRLDAATTAMIVVGSAFAAASVPLILFGGPGESSSVSARVGPGGAWLRVAF